VEDDGEEDKGLMDDSNDTEWLLCDNKNDDIPTRTQKYENDEKFEKLIKRTEQWMLDY